MPTVASLSATPPKFCVYTGLEYITLRSARTNELEWMLVDDGSTVNILFDYAFDQMDVDHELMAISEPLLDFTGDSLILRERITLAVDFRESPCHLKKFMEFLLVDTRSAYHGVL
ncbi:Uncharacterized protein Adt_04950 [Abeliophyllum distichum]|uniref:Uncharacterized protein n=1 Tax=Abeliophyllum distichum TaxID=126358 RepID=A0ABD1V2Q2_9LAMI